MAGGLSRRSGNGKPFAGRKTGLEAEPGQIRPGGIAQLAAMCFLDGARGGLPARWLEGVGGRSEAGGAFEVGLWLMSDQVWER